MKTWREVRDSSQSFPLILFKGHRQNEVEIQPN